MTTTKYWVFGIISAFILFWAVREYHDKWYCHCTVGGDFYAYYQFGKDGTRETVWPAEYQHTVNEVISIWGGKANFMYAEATRPVFWLFAQLPIEQSYLVWYILQVISTMFLVWMLLKIDYGWILALAGLKIIIFNFESGNVALMLAALSVTTLGCFASAIFKPYYLLFGLLPSIIRRRFAGLETILLMLTGVVIYFAFDNAYLQVIQGNDGTTWDYHKYFILLAPLLFTLWKCRDIPRIKKYWYVSAWISSALLVWSILQWWLSPASRALLFSEIGLLWMIVLMLVIILAFVVTLTWIFGTEEEKRVTH